MKTTVVLLLLSAVLPAQEDANPPYVGVQSTNPEPPYITHNILLRSGGNVLDIVMKDGRVVQGSLFSGKSPFDVELYFIWGNQVYWLYDPLDRGEIPLNVQMQCTNGTLTLVDNPNITYISGDGKDDYFIEFEGTISEVNKVIEKITWTPKLDPDRAPPGEWQLRVTHAQGDYNDPPEIHIPDIYKQGVLIGAYLIERIADRYCVAVSFYNGGDESLLRDLSGLTFHQRNSLGLVFTGSGEDVVRVLGNVELPQRSLYGGFWR